MGYGTGSFNMNMYSRVRTYLMKKKYGLLKLGYGTSFSNVIFEDHNSVSSDSFILNSEIGRCTYISSNCNIVNAKIGRFCSIANNVKTCHGQHPTSVFVTTFPSFYYNTEKQIGFTFHKDEPIFDVSRKILPSGEFEIIIGNDVWVGSHVLLIPGITIGDGAIIAAGSVVTKDVPPYSIVGGVPAKIIRKRFCDYQIEKLLKLKWWDKSLEDIRRNYRLYSDIDTFLSWEE